MPSRVTLTRSGGGWFCFWAAALLVLPHCALQHATTARTNLDRGDPPRTSAVFCDIEKPLPMTTPPTARRCATPEDMAAGIRFADAAAALVAGRTGTVGLDDSPDAVAMCGDRPLAVQFQGPFPQGTRVCLNCGVIGPSPAPHVSNAAVCTAHCLDLFAVGDANVPPTAAATTFCATGARLATNFAASAGTRCFDNACNTMGGVRAGFVDPRVHPEPVDWTNAVGVTVGAGGSLSRHLPFTGNFDAGASSMQMINRVITGGDAYLEFTATETNTTRIAGLSSGPAPAGGVQFANIEFGIELYNTGEMFVVENGSAVSSFGVYAAGRKFRVKLHDRFNGTAAVTYQSVGACTDGSECPANVFYTSRNLATYPVRVDAMFQDVGGTVTEARIVYIR